MLGWSVDEGVERYGVQEELRQHAYLAKVGHPAAHLFNEGLVLVAHCAASLTRG